MRKREPFEAWPGVFSRTVPKLSRHTQPLLRCHRWYLTQHRWAMQPPFSPVLPFFCLARLRHLPGKSRYQPKRAGKAATERKGGEEEHVVPSAHPACSLPITHTHTHTNFCLVLCMVALASHLSFHTHTHARPITTLPDRCDSIARASFFSSTVFSPSCLIFT